MARNIYKFTTIGLAALVVSILVLVTAPPTYWMAATNNQPNDLENIPDGWSVWTWENSDEEAIYLSTYDNCEITIAKHDSDNQTVTVDLSLTCGNENPGTTHAVRGDGEEHVFITEPANFDFEQGMIDECHMSIEYFDQLYDGETILVDFACYVPYFSP